MKSVNTKGSGKSMLLAGLKDHYHTLHDCGTIKKVILLFVYVLISKERQKKMVKKKFNPEDVIGKPYARGLLPYGGSVTKGKISFAVSEEEHLEKMKRLRLIRP